MSEFERGFQEGKATCQSSSEYWSCSIKYSAQEYGTHPDEEYLEGFNVYYGVVKKIRTYDQSRPIAIERFFEKCSEEKFDISRDSCIDAILSVKCVAL